MPPSASIVVPTRARPDYLEVALASIAPQAVALNAELVVADDGGLEANRRAADRHGASYVGHDAPRGPNAARNTGIAAASGELVVLVDDDVRAPGGWLDALVRAAAERPDDDVFGGPIRVALEGFRWRTCGREGPPVTFLDLGPNDREADFVWSANMAIRRRALERVGSFDASVEIYGDEEDWQRRHRASGGRIRYVAAAGLEHRRAPRDARVGALARAAFARGRSSRRYDERKGVAPSLGRELRTLLGCAAHTVRFRCAFGVPMTAAAWGRVSRVVGLGGALPTASLSAGTPPTSPLRPAESADGRLDDFLSGSPGVPFRRRAVVGDALEDLELLARRVPSRLRRAAAEAPRRRVLVLGVVRADVPGLMDAARRELTRSRHEVEVCTAPAGGGGKFENLNALLAAHPRAEAHDWLLLVDDDVALPRGFLDRFLFLAERFDLALAAPAHRHRSHAAWELTRRRHAAIVRETAWVEIGPVVALRADTWAQLLPFPSTRMGWGLDAHWAALAREHGWTVGIVDATPIRHLLRPIATGYAAQEAVEEARAFLAERPYLSAQESQRTLATHSTW
ncbi:MAG: glycosyltransferase family 2 protein [Solirubrobacteraceae bacterium]